MSRYINYRIKILSLIWLILVIVSSPLLIVITIRQRKKIVRLPEASGKSFGKIEVQNSSSFKRLAFIGESPVAGVGVSDYKDSLTATTAAHLVKLSSQTIEWRAVGKNGITIAQTCEKLVPVINQQSFDYLVIILGVNDVTGLNSLNQWQQGINNLISAIKKHSDAPILFYGCPPLGKFPALPKPLAWAAGFRAYLFDQITLQHDRNGKDYIFIPFKASVNSEHFAKDGYHPSELGCLAMGEQIAQDIKTHFA